MNKAKSRLRNKNKTNKWDLRVILGTMNHDVIELTLLDYYAMG